MPSIESLPQAESEPTRPSSAHQPGLPTGPRGLPKQRPALAQLRDAMTALHIGRLCRAVSYELFTYWSPGGTVFPSVKALADGMGLKRRAVRHHIAHLERVGLWVRIGRDDETNLYVLHLPGEAQAGFVTPTPLHTAADPPARTCPPPGTHMPPEVITEVSSTSSSRARIVCERCKNDWPAEYGTKCYTCGHDSSKPGWTPADDTPTDEPTVKKSGRIRNCPNCPAEDRGADDCCTHCGWIAPELEKKGAGGVNEGGGVDEGVGVEAAPPPQPDFDLRHRWIQKIKARYGRPTISKEDA